MVMDLLAQERSDEALKRCQALAREIRSLDGVKFVSAFFSYDGSLLTITYTAEENVELDSIRKTLAREFSVSTEMRRIGARDAAKLVESVAIEQATAEPGQKRTRPKAK